MFEKYILIFLVIFTFGCAHHNDVRPGNDGIHRVTFKTEEKGEGFQMAMSQAKHYCKEVEGNRSPVVVSEDSKYSGRMDEDSYNKGKTVSKVAQGVGGAAIALGGRKEKSLGGIVGIGGAVANSALGEGYSFEMKFTCK